MSLLHELPVDWRNQIESRMMSADVVKIETHLNATPDIRPLRSEIFKAFHLCPYEHTKVVIIGQDPCPNGRATGLAFAVKA